MQTSFSPFEEVGLEEFERIVRTTLVGQVNGTRLALRHMERGNIVNVGSAHGYRPVPCQAAYCAAKHGLNGFTAALRSDLLRDGRPLTLSLVQLPALNTPQSDWALNRLPKTPQPAPPIFQPDVAARAVLRAIDTEAREIFVGQSVLKLVFGNFVAPDWLDRKLARDGAELQKSRTDEPGGRPGNLLEPAPHASGARGSLGGRALTLDGDKARYLAFGGAVGPALVIGLVLGGLID